MEDIKERRIELQEEVENALHGLSDKAKRAKTQEIENRLFQFANFLESRIALLYISGPDEVFTENIIKKSFEYGKIVVLPAAVENEPAITLVKIDNPDTDLRPDGNGRLLPDLSRCKAVPIDCIDIAIIPGLVFDEKGGRIGTDEGYYNRLIGKLPITTRRVALAFENQIYPQVPMEPNDKFVDIIISDRRVIYKI
jgi:5-formyltetrahydrofolate cyclo-ligase